MDSQNRAPAPGATLFDVVRDVVSQVAPEEVTVVQALGQLKPDRVAGLLRGRREERLGFGLVDAAALVTPVVWIAVDEVSRSAVEAGIHGFGPRLAARIRRLLRIRPPLPSSVPPLSPGQLDAVHARVLDGASAAGLDPAVRAALADHVVARLARELPTSEQDQAAAS
jgi:hypothetical protein